MYDMLRQPEKEDVLMHAPVNALSDFCKLLYLSTPSPAGMHDLLEKTGVDPIGPLSANDSAAHAEIFAACNVSVCVMRRGSHDRSRCHDAARLGA